MEWSKRLPLELDQCISAVITAMRQNAKWAVVPGNYKVGHTSWPACQPCLLCVLPARAVTPTQPTQPPAGGGPHGARASLRGFQKPQAQDI
jgi:hypothetical protein